MSIIQAVLSAIDSILSHPMALALAPVALTLLLTHILNEKKASE